ncbi:class I SAM-dependent methyltransferase [Catenuloplanes atrovinosus]|uniref:Methyltransferase (TIGR00027 family) n=1 Tax=Catenuloplanes atrovinosus TaxID=137266 RepID=A0AAE4C8V2_9ACTN|nr:class I SAM-dependent methyltransferase [Catenuloplanes atrovinosus]MDR7275007.1 methyltransferase (TIGR00027 family) [Catenuloplanes atrovinosus]
MVRVRLTEARETLLVTLYARALDARAAHPVLGDTMAAAAVDAIDYDFSATGISPQMAPTVAVRARFLDGWVREFLREHDGEVTVVHLGAGLDTRVWRVDPRPGAEWYDVDFPDVVELRHTLFPDRPGYHTIGASVTDDGWLDRIPAGHPTLAIAEGLSMYLTEEQGISLLRRITGRFGEGTTIAFDAFNRLAIRAQKLNPAVRLSGATLHWSVDDPHDPVRAVPGLRLRDAVDAITAPGTEELPRVTRLLGSALRPIPAVRHMSRYLRYER